MTHTPPLPEDDLNRLLQADENGDFQWLEWLRDASERTEEAEQEKRLIDIARASEIKYRLYRNRHHNIDEIDIGDLL